MQPSGKKYAYHLVRAVGLCMLLAGMAVGDSAFTYQGQLTDAGQPANGSYDLLFTLLDDEDIAVGAPIPKENLIVVDGLFSVTLDFGAEAFSGEDRFLEIGVRPGDSGSSFTVLSPRQRLTATPYATTALNTVGIDGHSLDAPDGSPTNALAITPDGRVNVDHGGIDMYDDVNHGVSLTSGKIRFFDYPTENPVYNYYASTQAHRFFTNAGLRMIITGDGNVGIGRSEPGAKLDVGGAVAMTGLRLGSSATPGHVLTASASGVGTWQEPAVTDAYWQTDDEDNIHYGDGNVGIGMGASQPPEYLLHVMGEAYVSGHVGVGTPPADAALGVGGDVKADAFAYQQPQEHVLTILGAEMLPPSPTTQFTRSAIRGLSVHEGVGSAIFSAQVRLPDNATITSLTSYFSDVAAASSLAIVLYRNNLDQMGPSEIASVSVTGSPGMCVSETSTDINHPNVDNTTFAYELLVWSEHWMDGLEFHGAKITYTVDGPS